MLNLEDCLTSTPNDPINMMNLVWYCEASNPKEMKIADLFLHMSASNNFLTVNNRKLQYTIRSTDNLEDFEDMDESKKRAQITKKCAVLGGC